VFLGDKRGRVRSEHGGRQFDVGLEHNDHDCDGTTGARPQRQHSHEEHAGRGHGGAGQFAFLGAKFPHCRPRPAISSFFTEVSTLSLFSRFDAKTQTLAPKKFGLFILLCKL